ncbi:cellulase family glycosylhydrolase [Chondromyces apiculatus]|uniref:Glycoside hydrolase family 5 domain-containing protein n=1 Tax=Chondromyces apiculatus DSM 436 TaxID=1192034 RepID=A0A017T9Z2_9BACT|nr:cellulase family glycosylhydrolase [Chondromyces apiculatus]EYF06078.1 Hypothetical protein CAP_2268 [Chondromyces apiculatus DSM 436]
MLRPANRLRLGFPLLAATLLASAPCAAAGALHVEGGFFRDARGGAVILRGVNVAGDSKVPPFMPAAEPTLFDPLRDAGMNVVRLLFTWEAYEPEPGAYDAAYLDYYAAAARAAGERGLHVVVDFHQDGFSRFTIGGCGDGFPRWALPPELAPLEPDNGPDCVNWGVRMAQDTEMMTAWTAFYADTHGARTRFLLMLESVSERLAGEPAVIGYDILNEPWGDEATEIPALHADAAAALRKASPEAIVFVSPHALTSAGKATELPPPTFENVAYAPHFYDAMVALLHTWNGTDPAATFDLMQEEATAWGAPLFLGEFGAPAEAGNAIAYMDALYGHLDARLASGAQWVYTPGWTDTRKDGWNQEDFSIVDGEGTTRPNFRLRPAARRIAGTPTGLQVTTVDDPESGTITLAWDHDPDAGETELFVPLASLTRAARARLRIETEGDALDCTAEGARVTCTSPTAGAKRVKVSGAQEPEEAPACGLMGIEPLALGALAALAQRRRRARSRAGRRPRR